MKATDVAPDTAQPTMGYTVFEYMCMHNPTRECTVRRVKFMSARDFLEHLNLWNRLGDGTWIYWST